MVTVLKPGANRQRVVFRKFSLSLSLSLPSLFLSLSLSACALAFVWRLVALSLSLPRCLSLDFGLGARDSEGVVADLPRR